MMNGLRRTSVASLLAALALAFGASTSQAVPVGSPAPWPGFEPDSGFELFTYQDNVISFEIFDALGPQYFHEFSFYYACLLYTSPSPRDS